MSFDLGMLVLVCFGITVLIQIAYQLFFFSRLAFYKANRAVDRGPLPVSVVVCTRDEAENLQKRLPVVLEQDYPAPHEVIVVNDNSVDDTTYILEDMQVKYRHLKPVELKQEAMHIPGKKFPLAVGIKSAKHDILLLTDADCMPISNQWISQMQSAYSEGIEIVLGYGAYERQHTVLNRLIRFETFHTAIQYLSYALAGLPYMGVGRNLSYRRELFFRHKGFSAHNQIPGGDDDLFINMAATDSNTAIMVHPEAITRSVPKKNFSEWARQKFRHYSTGRHYHLKHRFLLGLYALSYVLLLPLFVASILHGQWETAMYFFGARWLVMGVIYRKAMMRLGEGDLWPFFWLLDIWQFFYYIIFIRAPWKAPKPGWK